MQPLENKKNRIIYHKRALKRMSVLENRMVKSLRGYFKRQKNRILENLESNQKGLADQVFLTEQEKDRAVKIFFPMLKEFSLREGQDVMDRLDYDYDYTLTSEIRSFLKKKTDIFCQQMNETTFKKLQKEFQESLAEGEGRRQLVKRVEDTYDNISKHRAETIARTEVHGVATNANFKGYKQAGIKSKIWVAVLDMKTRESHQMMDGEKKPMDMPFSNGLMYPGDPSGPPAEVINCRCVM